MRFFQINIQTSGYIPEFDIMRPCRIPRPIRYHKCFRTAAHMASGEGDWVATTALPGSGLSAWWRDMPRSERTRIAGCAGYMLVLLLLFIRPLTRLMLYAVRSDLHSHIVLVPFIVAYLLYLRRRAHPAGYRSSVFGTVIMAGLGVATLAAAAGWRRNLSLNYGLALMALAFVSFAVAGGFLFLGPAWMAARAFPVAFSIFMIPLPDKLVDWLEKASMLASAEAAARYFSLTGTPFVREGTVFELPGMVLQVAQECSGIRSSWVLLISGLLASHLFLRTRWRKIALVAFVIPLGILRNGFRILVIGLLCVHVGPHMIDSPIHHHGGPLFFALSMIPLFALLWWLRRQERRLHPPD